MPATQRSRMSSAGVPGRVLGTTSGKSEQAQSTGELRRSIGPRQRRLVPN